MRRHAVLATLTLSLALFATSGTGFAAVSAPVDSRWGTSGATAIDFGNVGGGGAELLFDRLGRIYAQAGQYVRIARLSPLGIRDTRWGSRGLVSAPRGTHAVAVGSRLILVNGTFFSSQSPSFTLQRLTDAGGIDSTFGSAGSLPLSIPMLPSPWTLESTYHGCEASTNSTGLRITSRAQWNQSADGSNDRRSQLVVFDSPVEALTGQRPPFATTVIEGPIECAAVDSAGRAWTVDGSLIQRYGPNGQDAIGPNGGGAPHPFDLNDGIPRIIGHGTGALVLGRLSGQPAAQSWTLIGLNDAGDRDSTFGNAGVVTLPSSLGARSYVMAFRATTTAIDIALGDPTSDTIELYRLDASGQGQASFGSNGKVVLKSTRPARATATARVFFDKADRAYVVHGIDGSTAGALIRRFATDAVDLAIATATQSTSGGWKSVAVTLTNRGPRSSATTVATISVPVGVSIRTPTSTNGSCLTKSTRTGTTIRCVAPSLAIGARWVITVEARRGHLPATLRATASAAGRRDVRPASNAASLAL